MSLDIERTRFNMVEQQVRPWDVFQPRVLETLARMPRERFVAESHRALAYADLALPIGRGEAMMKPVLEGRALEALAISAGEDVLEILAIPLLGVIPESQAVLRASNSGEPVILDKESDAGQAYEDAVARLLGDTKDFRFLEEEKKGFFSRLFGS